MAGGMRDAYTQIMDMCDDDGKPVAVDKYLMLEAQTCPGHEFFEADMLRRKAEQGLDDLQAIADGDEEWKDNIPWRQGDVGSPYLLSRLQDSCHSVVRAGDDWGMYEGLGSDLGRVRLYISSSPEARARAETRGGVMHLEDEDLVVD
jgi:hypothetical protein